MTGTSPEDFNYVRAAAESLLKENAYCNKAVMSQAFLQEKKALRGKDVYAAIFWAQVQQVLSPDTTLVKH